MSCVLLRAWSALHECVTGSRKLARLVGCRCALGRVATGEQSETASERRRVPRPLPTHQLTNSPTHRLTALIRRRAPSGAGVHPVLLDEIVLPVGEPHVVLAVVRRLRRT